MGLSLSVWLRKVSRGGINKQYAIRRRVEFLAGATFIDFYPIIYMIIRFCDINLTAL